MDYFGGGKMMETNEDIVMPKMSAVKEERLDFEEYCLLAQQQEQSKGETSRRGRTRSLSKKSGDKSDIKAKLERSRQSARECRARKKLRYQYLEEIISETERAINALRRELDCLRVWAKDMDEGRVPPQLVEYRRHFVERGGKTFRINPSDVLMEEQEGGIIHQTLMEHPVSSSPASSGIASASTSAGAGPSTMAFSPTSSAFAAMMLSPSSLTHTISPS